MYQKNEIYTVTVTDLGTEGEGIGKIDGYPLFVKDALPGDVVEARLTKVKKTYAYARMEKLLQPSPDRIDAACPYARQCGGCQIQALSYQKQLEYKERKVFNNLMRLGGVPETLLTEIMEPIIGMYPEDWEDTGVRLKNKLDSLFFNRQFESEPQIALIADEKPLARISHRVSSQQAALTWRISQDVVDCSHDKYEVPVRYRNKAQYPFGMDKEGRTVCGFYAGRTHNIIANTDCLLGAKENESILKAVLSYMEESHIKPYCETTGKGLVRHVLIRKSRATGQIMVCIVINGQDLPEKEGLIRKLTKIPGMYSISISPNEKNTNVILGDTYKTIWGDPKIADEICQTVFVISKDEDIREESAMGKNIDEPYLSAVCPVEKIASYGKESGKWERVAGTGIRFKISPLSFYQVNPVQMERLYSTALEYAGLTGKETVWDLYCGIGTISLFLAKKAKHVYGVEIVPQAIEDAKENAAWNQIDNVTFYVGKAEEVLPRFYEQQETGIHSSRMKDGGRLGTSEEKKKETDSMRHPDVIVVDPPRKGCDEGCLSTMVMMKPERIVYVSCDSGTLARDVKYLREHGYELKRVRACDMFPNTGHVEIVALLSSTASCIFAGKMKNKVNRFRCGKSV